MLIYVCKLRFKVRFCLALPSLATFSEAPAGIMVGGESESKGESESGVRARAGARVRARARAFGWLLGFGGIFLRVLRLGLRAAEFFVRGFYECSS